MQRKGNLFTLMVGMYIGTAIIKNSMKGPQKISRRSKETFLQSRQTDGQEAHEKMLNITNY